MIGHVYPVYKTFKAFKLSDEPEHLDEKQLRDLRRILSFWAVMGVFTFAEFFLDVLLSWLPLFWETKILFLAWLVHSNFAGAAFVYENFVDEVFREHELDIDHSLAICKARVRGTARGAAGMMARQVTNAVAMGLAKSQDMMLEQLARRAHGEAGVGGAKGGGGSACNGFRFEEVEVRIPMDTCMCMCMCVCVCVCLCVHICILSHALSRVHTRTLVHTHTQTNRWLTLVAPR